MIVQICRKINRTISFIYILRVFDDKTIENKNLVSEI